MPTFGVPASAHAYIDQFLTALLTLLDSMRSVSRTEIVVEGLDDIEIRRSGKLDELVQVKSHLAGGRLSDRSPDLWKTLRVWCELYKSGQLDPSTTDLVLVTTQGCALGSGCSRLRRAADRDVAACIKALDQIASKPNKQNASAYASYLQLAQAERRQLLDAVTIADSSSQGAALEADLRAHLQISVFREDQLDHLLSELVGWWIQRIASSLRQTDDAIQASELRDAIRNIMNNLRRETLPISKEIQEYTREFDTDDEAFLFVRQLRLVTDSDGVVLRALHDYLRCAQQVSEWVRDSLLFIDEGDRYANDLRDSWQFSFDLMLAKYADETDADALKSAGFDLFSEMMKQDRPIKPECRESFIMRGSYHRLANELLVGWHALFSELLK